MDQLFRLLQSLIKLFPPYDMRALCHGNSKGNQSRPYIRTSKEVFSKTKYLLKEGNTCKETYDKVNALSGGVYESSSQSNELRN